MCLSNVYTVVFWTLFGTQKIFELLSVGEVPDLDSPISSRSDQSPTLHVKGASCELWVLCITKFVANHRLCLEFGHDFTIFNIPDVDKAVIISRDHSIEVMVIAGE